MEINQLSECEKRALASPAKPAEHVRCNLLFECEVLQHLPIGVAF